MEYHVTPVGDLIEHEDSEDCVCGPDWKEESGSDIYVHHSLDNRELEEA